MHISEAEYRTLVAKGLLPDLGNSAGTVVRAANRIYCVIYGTPVGKPRMTRRDVWKKRSPVVKYREWCDKARSVIGPLPPAQQVKSVSITAHFEPHKSWSKKKRLEAEDQPHRQKPDIDNVIKTVCDCFWQDDASIYAVSATKLWAREAKLEVEILLND